jgi:hypothetical protein
MSYVYFSPCRKFSGCASDVVLISSSWPDTRSNDRKFVRPLPYICASTSPRASAACRVQYATDVLPSTSATSWPHGSYTCALPTQQ